MPLSNIILDWIYACVMSLLFVCEAGKKIVKDARGLPWNFALSASLFAARLHVFLHFLWDWSGVEAFVGIGLIISLKKFEPSTQGFSRSASRPMTMTVSIVYKILNMWSSLLYNTSYLQIAKGFSFSFLFIFFITNIGHIGRAEMSVMSTISGPLISIQQKSYEMLDPCYWKEPFSISDSNVTASLSMLTHLKEPSRDWGFLQYTNQKDPVNRHLNNFKHFCALVPSVRLGSSTSIFLSSSFSTSFITLSIKAAVRI